MKNCLPAALLMLVLGATAARAETLVLYSGAEEDGFVALGQEGGLGDAIVWRSDLTEQDGTRVGSNAGHCARVSAEGHFMCSFVIDHEGRGAMTFAGVQMPEPEPSRLVITGGTGAYEGAVGELVSTPVEDRARFRYEIDIRRAGAP